MASFLKVTQVRSLIGRPSKQRLAMKSIGLGKMHRTVFLEATPDKKGVVRKVSHLVRVEVVDEKAMETFLAAKAVGNGSYEVIPASAASGGEK